jgi:type III restriction enzyme
MALHPKFPQSPYDVVDPEYRWFPADEQLREKGYEKLLPPLVAELRKKVKAWRDAGYENTSETSRALLQWWFLTDHPMTNDAGETFLFQYYFPQREAVEDRDLPP